MQTVKIKSLLAIRKEIKAISARVKSVKFMGEQIHAMLVFKNGKTYPHYIGNYNDLARADVCICRHVIPKN